MGGSTSNTENLDREGADKVSVNVSGTTEMGKTNVEEEDSLEEPVERNPVEDSVGPELQNGEGGVDDPVGQVLSVISSRSGFKAWRVVTRDNEGSKVGKKLSNSN